VCVRPLINSIK